MIEIPVLCICFNRYDTSNALFLSLRKLGYKEIYLSIDGSRNLNDEVVQSEIIRNAKSCFIKVHLNHLRTNHGVSLGPVKALDWFFSKVDFGIVLEDDIIPTKSFFDFVEEMYKKYNGVENILTINSGSYSTVPEKLDLRYYFSGYVYIWGWATWSYVWKKYRVVITKEEVFKLMSVKIWQSKWERNYWQRNFLKDYTYHWDFQLSFLSFKLGAINITPTRTLTENIGFVNSSHRFLIDPIRERPAFNGNLPQFCPKEMSADNFIDYLTYKETRSYHWTRLLRLYESNGLKRIFSFILKRWML